MLRRQGAWNLQEGSVEISGRQTWGAKGIHCTKPGVEAGSGHKASSAQEPLELVLQAAASHKKSF